MRYKIVDECTKYSVAAGDSLKSIANANNCSLKDLVYCNWGTEDANAICRALFEIVGTETYPKDWENHVFDGEEKNSKRGTGELLLPGEWMHEGIAIDQVHEFTVRDPKPATAIRIKKLDKWFVPGPSANGGDLDDIEYALEGSEERANNVAFEVFASNYCSAAVDSDGKVSYTPIAETTPIYTEVVETGLESTAGNFAVSNWEGKSTAAKGVLKPRAPKMRYVNVAFSPYTVLLRFYKEETAKPPRLTLGEFWPRWDDSMAIVADSLKVKWKIEDAAKLKHGTLRIVDKTDTVVFVAALKEADLNNGDHEFPWSGEWTSETDSGAEPDETNMPYRVQIEAHTDVNEDAGVALAAMHTEVRIFAHEDTSLHSGADTYKNPNSLTFGWASWVPEAEQAGDGQPWRPKPPEQGANVDAWYQYQLAEAGFHPGPVDGAHGTGTKIAIREFQRSAAKGAAAPFTRIDPSGSVNADTTALLANLAVDSRPLYGKAADQKGYASRAAAMTDMNKNVKGIGDDSPGEIIVWAEERHYYTEHLGSLPPTLTNRANTLMKLKNYRGGILSDTDSRMRMDRVTMARPWLPLEVDIQLMRRDGNGDGLASAVRRPADDNSRAAIGPLRVDWTFEEIGEDLDRISPLDPGTGKPTAYNPDRTRTRKYVAEAVKAQTKTHKGKTYTNCPKIVSRRDNGGIRPDDLSTYYKVVFGSGSSILKPWKVHDDSANEWVSTFIHDDLGQAETEVYPIRRGRTGVYFRPSTIAGDGYRVRAQLSLAEPPSGVADFPNREVLQRRYTLLPQAHTASMRVWRKMSMRGVIAWAPAGKRKAGVGIPGIVAHYKRAFVHTVAEGAAPDVMPPPVELGPVASAPSTWTAANALLTEAEYQAIVTATVTDRRYRANPVTLSPDCFWPYTTMKGHGLPNSGVHPAAPPAQSAMQKLYSKLQVMFDRVIGGNFFSDIGYAMQKQMEDRLGAMKGLTVLDAMYTDGLTCQEYNCSSGICNISIAEVINGPAPLVSLQGTACPSHRDNTGARCAGTWNANGGTFGYVGNNGLGGTAIGQALGVSILHIGFSRSADVWAHEVGHNRHFEHASANPNPGSPPPGGYKLAQHDSRRNTVDPAPHPNHPGGATNRHKDHGWDLNCTMSYNDTEPQFFCGKCILKNRGWAIQRLANPASTVTD